MGRRELLHGKPLSPILIKEKIGRDAIGQQINEQADALEKLWNSYMMRQTEYFDKASVGARIFYILPVKRIYYLSN